MKAIIIQGCKDCPYAYCDSHTWNIWHCTHGQFQILDKLNESLPDTPNIDCKLNDLPDIADINYFASSVSPVIKKARVEGANYIIEQISK